MYIEVLSTHVSGRVHKCTLLRESFREGGKVKHKTIANLTHCSEEDVAAIRFALKHKKDLPQGNLGELVNEDSCQQGLHVGAVAALSDVAKKLGITKSLGTSRQGMLALWQVIARIIKQGSRLSAMRLAEKHAVCDILDLDNFTEDHLYRNLDWLAKNQSSIEAKLFKLKSKASPAHLFLYDVTSSYFEGDENEYADWGYNRDKKRGKKQIVIGLLTDAEGDPISVQVFRGNTSDNKTVVEQVQKVIKRFGVKRSIFVGDRGMIKGPQLKEFKGVAKHITAITTAQIKTLMKKGIISLEMFKNDQLHTVQMKGFRYILRRNPVRRDEINTCRMGKLKTVEALISEKNIYLKKSGTSEKTALKAVNNKIKRLGLHKWLSVVSKKRILSLKTDDAALEAATTLDGCYALRSDVKESSETTSDILHSRYKDLALVETAFRTMKTNHLEIRPHYVRKGTHTDGHVFVVMMAYKIVRHIREAWKGIEVTVEEGIEELVSICLNTIESTGMPFNIIPKPRPLAQRLLNALGVELPKIIPARGINVSPRKKLSRVV